MELRKAERRKVKARIGISGTSGSGKTYSALRMAYGMCGNWDKIALIDTEGGRGELYSNTTIRGIEIGEYNYLALDEPFTPQRYIEAIKTCEDAGMEVIIVDSLSHAWAGTGGMLEMKDKFATTAKNDFSAWRKVTPEHTKLVETLLRVKAHLIITVRAKTEYTLVENEKGKMEPRKVGMAPVFRDGLEYEMTIFMEINQEHNANASKDNTGIFDGVPFMPTEETGKAIVEWLESGKEPAPPPELDKGKVQRLGILRRQKGVSEEKHKEMLDKAGVSSSKYLTEEQYKKYVEWMEKRPDIQAEEPEKDQNEKQGALA